LKAGHDVDAQKVVIPAKAGIQYAAAAAMIAPPLEYWIIRRSLSSGRPKAGPGGG